MSYMRFEFVVRNKGAFLLQILKEKRLSLNLDTRAENMQPSLCIPRKEEGNKIFHFLNEIMKSILTRYSVVRGSAKKSNFVVRQKNIFAPWTIPAYSGIFSSLSPFFPVDQTWNIWDNYNAREKYFVVPTTTRSVETWASEVDATICRGHSLTNIFVFSNKGSSLQLY